MRRNSARVGDPIPDDDHIVRYRKKDIWEMARKKDFDPEIFESKTYPNAGVSVNWLEYYCGDEWASLKKIRKSTTYSGIRTSGGFLKLRVSDLKKISSELPAGNLRVVYDGKDPNWSHAEVQPPGATTFNALALCANHHGTVLRVPVLDD